MFKINAKYAAGDVSLQFSVCVSVNFFMCVYKSINLNMLSINLI
jgi:hypothetical protein